MDSYHNLNGKSGVRAYEIGDTFIKVQFYTGKIYTYTYSSAGSSNIETMKTLALNSQGLNTFINSAKPNYSSKF